MTRLSCVVLAAVLAAPAAAGAQDAPPLPPLPPVPVAPAVPPSAPIPPLPPEPPVPVVPEIAPVPLPAPRPLAVPAPPGDAWQVTSKEWQAWGDQVRAEMEQFQLSAEQQREIAEQARLASQQARLAAEDLRSSFFVDGLMDLDLNFDFDVDFDLQRPTPVIVRGRGNDGRGLYNSGLNALQRREYDQAIQLFDRVIAQKGDQADAATYWKAFSQARLVRTDDALATIAALRRDFPKSRYLGEAQVLEADVRRDFPKSRYLGEAQVLEADVRRLAGQRVDPQTLDANDEIKLIAINGIARTEPDRAIPLLEGVLGGANTLANKRRALFVLALIKDPRAHQILLRYAKGAGSPELQLEAIRNLVSRRDAQTTDAELREIYQAVDDPAVRRAVIDAYRAAGNKAALLDVARNKAEDTDVRRAAVARLNDVATPAELRSLYQGETDVELRAQIIDVLGAMDAVGELSDIARTEKESRLRIRALRRLGGQGVEATGSLLVGLYAADADVETRRTIITALRSQGNAEALVNIARKETSLELKREIVRALSDMAPTNKAAADFLTEMIK